MTKFAIGSLRFQEGSRIVLRGSDAIRLSNNEYVVFLTLCETGSYRDPDRKRLDQVIYRLRQKLGLEARIMSDRDNGYRLLNAEVAQS
jgi:hypothetical protein